MSKDKPFKGDNITLVITVDHGRLHVASSSIDESPLKLRPDQILQVEIVDGSVLGRVLNIMQPEEPEILRSFTC